MYFLSMKTYDVANNDFPLVSYQSEHLSALIDESETMTSILCRHENHLHMPLSIRQVIDNNFNKMSMTAAIAKMALGEIEDFEWSFQDKFGRKVLCFITSNV